MHLMFSKSKEKMRVNEGISEKKSLKLNFDHRTLASICGESNKEDMHKVFGELWAKMDKEYSQECLFCGDMIIEWAFKCFDLDLDTQIFKI